MTREEAIARIKDHKVVHKMNEPRAIYISEALDIAIEALEKEPKTGHWLGDCEGEIDGTYHCSVCYEWVVWDDINYAYTYRFCPWCGADMREEESEEE